MPDRRFDDFYAFDYGKLVTALSFVTGDVDLARDAVDETCARALERVRRGDEIDVLAAWIRVVSRNVARGRIRRLVAERRARARLAARPVDAAAADTAGEVVVMHYFLDQSVETIARELEIPVGTVKSILHRARAVMAHSLGASAPEPAEEKR